MNSVLTNIKERNMDISLNDIKFFMAYDDEECFITPVLINKDSTKAKDLRIGCVYDIKANKNGSKDMGSLFLSVMQKYDKNMGNNFDVSNFPKKLFAQEMYTYEQVFHKFYKEPYNMLDESACPIGYSSKFFKKYHILLKQNFIAKRKEIVKFCDSIQSTKEKVLREQNNREKLINKSENNREF